MKLIPDDYFLLKDWIKSMAEEVITIIGDHIGVIEAESSIKYKDMIRNVVE